MAAQFGSANRMTFRYCLWVVLGSCCFGGCATTPYQFGGDYHTANDMPLPPGTSQVERGRSAPIIDSIGWLAGSSRRLFLLRWNADNHDVSFETERKLSEYLALNGLDKVKVRINEYDPCGEWERLKNNRSICGPLRYTFGTLYMAGYTLLPGRIWGGDSYCVWTNTVHLYSDVPELAIYQGAKAKECAKREYKWLGPSGIQAMRDTFGYLDTYGTADELRDAYICLYPNIVFEVVPLWTPFGLPAIGAGHVAGRTVGISVHNKEVRENSNLAAPTNDDADRVVRLPNVEEETWNAGSVESGLQ